MRLLICMIVLSLSTQATWLAQSIDCRYFLRPQHHRLAVIIIFAVSLLSPTISKEAVASSLGAPSHFSHHLRRVEK